MMHPVPPLKLVAEQFVNEVDALTGNLRAELGGKQSERLETFRRKFVNFELGELGSSAEHCLKDMRLQAEKEKLMSAIGLYNNRKWYMQLLSTIKQSDSLEQRDLLKTVRDLIESGAGWDKSTVPQYPKP